MTFIVPHSIKVDVACKIFSKSQLETASTVSITKDGIFPLNHFIR